MIRKLLNIHKNLNRSSIIVLCYHRIIERHDIPFFVSMVNASCLEFAEELDFIASQAEVVSEDYLLRIAKRGTINRDTKILLTFDDGYQDFYYNAYPLLKRKGIPATMFITTNCIKDKNFIFWTDKLAYAINVTKKRKIELYGFGSLSLGTWRDKNYVKIKITERMKVMDEVKRELFLSRIAEYLEIDFSGFPKDCYLSLSQIKEMGKQGISFGSHSRSHPILTRISIDRLREEIGKSKIELEGLLGNKIHSFAYPNGTKKDFNKQVIGLVKNSGYNFAFTMIGGVNIIDGVMSNRYALKRINAGTSARALKQKLIKLL